MPDDVAAGRLRILLVSTDFGGGGAEEQVKLLLAAFGARGHEVRWASLQDVGPYADDVAALGLPAISLGMRRGVPDPRGVLRLAREVRSFRPHVVHSHMVHANLLARVTRLLARMPVQISTAHNISEGGRWRELAYRATDPLCTLTTNVSQAAVDRYVRVGVAPRRKIRYFPNGLDLRRFPGQDSERRQDVRGRLGVGAEFVWLAAGRLVDAKDFPSLLRAMGSVLASQPDTRLFIAGDGPERAALEDLRAGLGLPAGQVRFLGLRRDMLDLMQAADGYVMSSAWEGLPMVLLEASASHLPIVATDVGGNREAVVDGESGVLVPPHEPTHLAAAMTRLMAMRLGERARMGLAGRRHVESAYSLEMVADRWLALYADLLARPSWARSASRQRA